MQCTQLTFKYVSALNTEPKRAAMLHHYSFPSLGFCAQRHKECAEHIGELGQSHALNSHSERPTVGDSRPAIKMTPSFSTSPGKRVIGLE